MYDIDGNIIKKEIKQSGSGDTEKYTFEYKKAKLLKEVFLPPAEFPDQLVPAVGSLFL